MINHNEMYPKVVAIITDVLALDDAQKVTPQATLTSLGVDSIDTIEIVMRLEEEFDIQINDDEFETKATVGDVVTYIGTLQNK